MASRQFRPLKRVHSVSIMGTDYRDVTVHELVGETLVIEDDGIIGRCTCGWNTGHRISGMVASVAFMEHQIDMAEAKDGLNLI